MFTLNIATGVVTRNRDGKVVSPCQSYHDHDHLAYVNWVESGGVPETIDAPEMSIDQLKAARQSAVDSIVVTTSSGRSFDGDEVSQDRMTRAITTLNDGESIPWVLADNQIAMVDRSE